MAFPAFVVLLDLWVILVLRAGACRVCPRAGTPGWAQGTHPQTAGTQCPPELPGMELSTHMWVLYLLKCLLGQISSRKWLLRNRREIKMGSYNILLRQENDRDIFGRSASTGIFTLFLAATVSILELGYTCQDDCYRNGLGWQRPCRCSHPSLHPQARTLLSSC